MPVCSNPLRNQERLRCNRPWTASWGGLPSPIQVSRQLGLTFLTELLGVSKNSSHASERDLVGISSSSVKRWAEVLRDSEVATIQWLASTEMNEYGYDIEDSSLRSQGAVSVHVLSSVPSLMKRLIDRYRLGGATLVSSVLRNYAKRLLALR